MVVKTIYRVTRALSLYTPNNSRVLFLFKFVDCLHLLRMCDWMQSKCGAANRFVGLRSLVTFLILFDCYFAMHRNPEVNKNQLNIVAVCQTKRRLFKFHEISLVKYDKMSKLPIEVMCVPSRAHNTVNSIHIFFYFLIIFGKLSTKCFVR